MLKVFALRNKHTGLFIPPTQGRGGSFTEPNSKTPRLWPTRKGPQGFLDKWLNGHYVRDRQEMSYGLDEGFFCPVKVLPQAHRKAADMEIVEYVLIEQGGL